MNSGPVPSKEQGHLAVVYIRFMSVLRKKSFHQISNFENVFIKLARIIGEYMSPRTMCIKRFLCNSNKPIRKIFQCAILANELTVET